MIGHRTREANHARHLCSAESPLDRGKLGRGELQVKATDILIGNQSSDHHAILLSNRNERCQKQTAPTEWNPPSLFYPHFRRIS